MKTSFGISLLVLAATCLLANGQDIVDTTGMRYEGFTMVGNVAGYSNMTLDLCKIKRELFIEADFPEALDIYENGTYSMGRTGLRKFKTWAASMHPNTTTYEMLLSYHKSETWLDKAILAAVAAKSAEGVMGLIGVATHYKYFWHEVEEAFEKTEEGNNNKTSGAPHNLDEAWAIWSGAHPSQCGESMMEIANTLAEELGTSYYGQSPINMAFTTILNDLQYYSLMGNATGDMPVTMYNASMQALRVQYAAVLTQGMMREAYAASIAVTCKSATALTAARTKATTYWVVLAPQLSAWGATTAQLKAVESELLGMTATYSKVAAALVACLPKAIDVSALGTPVDAKINTIKGCKV